MKLISHRGNVEGKKISLENNPEYINTTISLGYDVEIDVWMIGEELFLGHDGPEYAISRNWLNDRCDKLWIHCKNIEAVEWFNDNDSFNWFWHETDTITITSKGFIWAYPGKQPILGSIAVMPEIHNDNINKCKGICSDYIEKYKK